MRSNVLITDHGYRKFGSGHSNKFIFSAIGVPLQSAYSGQIVTIIYRGIIYLLYYAKTWYSASPLISSNLESTR
jgi:hypothetical protein